MANIGVSLSDDDIVKIKENMFKINKPRLSNPEKIYKKVCIDGIDGFMDDESNLFDMELNFLRKWEVTDSKDINHPEAVLEETPGLSIGE